MDSKKIFRAVKGNDKVFQELIQLEKNKLYRIAYLYVKNENDALDIVQETIYKAFRSKQKLKNAEYFSTWLTRILINNALNFIKKNKKVIPFAEEEMERLHESPEHPSIENRIDLVNAIDCLEESYKTVIILRYYKDFTIRQIAEFLNCPEGTVKTKIHRATNQLKRNIKEDCFYE
ncbi:sigma-70 family RNA polymerase sigma factor [Virgibacillus ndiopensis]|uniref:sigma-70 family RNA polymerase sigma factor n=1 Tax=Virgibacillus ndiopensis TaxID=2004408 RepID=UPI000C07274C|nr:sigma-70 family RNA polymerase sigma factor [Virgibacillus ndiopensis]